MADDKPSEDKPKKDYSKKVPHETLFRISEKLNEKSGGQAEDKCPVCGSPHNTVLETEYSIPLAQTEPLLGIGAHIPSYATACINCGYLRFFSKLMIDRMISEDDAAIVGGEDG